MRNREFLFGCVCGAVVGALLAFALSNSWSLPHDAPMVHSSACAPCPAPSAAHTPTPTGSDTQHDLHEESTAVEAGASNASALFDSRVPWAAQAELRPQALSSMCPAQLIQPQPELPLEASTSVPSLTYIRMYLKFRAARAMLGALSCKVNQLGPCGGWCDVGGVSLDRTMCGTIATIVHGSSVVELGAGSGHYGQCLQEKNAVTWWRGFDGAEQAEQLTDGRVGWADLTDYDPLLPVGDWVLSLEVVEHVPKSYEHIVLNNMHLHNTKGVILSWAIPGQSGFHHVNCQTNDYALQRFAQFGCYQYDADASNAGRSNPDFWWFRNTFMVFRRMPGVPCTLLQPAQ